jgi:hypothetical protein
MFYERKATAKSVPRMPATEEIPRAEAPFEVAEAAPAEEEPVAWPVTWPVPVDGAAVTVGRPV